MTAQAATAQTAEWTWMGGNSAFAGQYSSAAGTTVNGTPGVYGMLNQPATGNVPGSREEAVSWTDKNGHLWLFGGSGLDANGTYADRNDLWEFAPTANEWAWRSGSSTGTKFGFNVGQPGIYGTLGSAATGNTPGSRAYAVGWTDASGNFWLFGGVGFDSAGNYGSLNDLWKFDPTLDEWAWMGGANILPVPPYAVAGVYGTQQSFSAGNSPGSRHSAITWTDAHGNLWLFGGYGDDSIGETGYLNDLWEYSPSLDQWAWMSGSLVIPGGGARGVYGQRGTPAPGNTPGARISSSGWVDATGNLWLFGGDGYPTEAKFGLLNDLWTYDASLKQWAWMGGLNTFVNCNGTCQAGVYGTLGQAAAGNWPGARDSSAVWTDSEGNVWLYGGGGYDSTGSSGNISLNDLWKFFPASDEWVWMGGNKTATSSNPTLGVYGTPGVYGTLGAASAANLPSGRSSSVGWAGTNGSLWLFGGYGMDSTTNLGYLNDLWQYQLATPAPTFSPAPGPYSSAQSVTLSDSVNGAVIYYTTDGTTPKTSSAVYSGPIDVSISETILAIALLPNYLRSAVASGVYTVTAPPSFTLTGVPGAVTLSAGSNGAYSLTITPQNGFNSAVSFACSGLPAGASCTFNPSTVAPAGAPVSTQLTLKTSALSAAARQVGSHGSLPAFALAMVFGLFGWRKRRSLTLLTIVATLTCLGMMSGCGNSSQSRTPQPQTSVVTLTAVSGALQQTATITLTVN